MKLPEKLTITDIVFELNCCPYDGWYYFTQDGYNLFNCRKINNTLREIDAPTMPEIAKKVFPEYKDVFYFPAFKDDFHIHCFIEELAKYGITDGSWRDKQERKKLRLT